MRNVLRRGGRWLGLGWFWAAVLLVLPNCTLNRSGIADPRNLYPGPIPRADAIFCDIERPSGRHCSTDLERLVGIRLSEAATALNSGRTSSIGLDDSQAALDRCGGQPETVEFQGAFPEGLPVCVNCGSVIGTATFPDVTAACRARCYDFFGTTESDGTVTPQNPPDASTRTFCDGQARASTNFPLDGCFSGACAEGGTLATGFVDPRRPSEPVIWQDLIGVASGGVDGNDLTRTAATTGNYDAGAVSSQWISRGDAFVEFSATPNNQAHVLGLTELPPGCSAPCPDTDANYTNIGFGIVLNYDGRYYVVEHGTIVPGPDVNGSFGTYSVGERFRIGLTQNPDGTARVAYSRLVGACTPGTMCNVVTFHDHPDAAAHYPLRVDTAIFDQASSLTDVRLVRIK